MKKRAAKGRVSVRGLEEVSGGSGMEGGALCGLIS